VTDLNQILANRLLGEQSIERRRLGNLHVWNLDNLADLAVHIIVEMTDLAVSHRQRRQDGRLTVRIDSSESIICLLLPARYPLTR